MNQTQSITAPRSKTYEITMTALMAAVTCILAPLSIPIGPVPISFTNLAIYLSLYLLGWKRGTISYLIYLLLGLVGLPVFSGFTGGPAKLAGPTGGYIIGFIVMAVIAGLVIDNCHKPLVQLIGMIVGTIVCYLFGTIWFCIVAHYTFKAALADHIGIISDGILGYEAPLIPDENLEELFMEVVKENRKAGEIYA